MRRRAHSKGQHCCAFLIPLPKTAPNHVSGGWLLWPCCFLGDILKMFLLLWTTSKMSNAVSCNSPLHRLCMPATHYTSRGLLTLSLVIGASGWHGKQSQGFCLHTDTLTSECNRWLLFVFYLSRSDHSKY